MEWTGEFWRKLLFAFRRRQFDRDLEEEMRFHVDMKAAVVGTQEARRRFGNSALLAEDSRAAWGWTRLEAWLADLKYALRALWKNPTFAAVAIITLALGIGTGTAVFSVVHAVVMRPLPFRDPDRIAALWVVWQRPGLQREDHVVVSYPVFRQWKEQSQSFAHMAAWDGHSAQIMSGGEPVELAGADVSGGFFEALGTQPMLGRVFVPDEERRSGPKVTILSYGLWQRLGGDPGVIGKTAQFDRESYTVVGVMPKGFAYPANFSELWFPFWVDDPRNDGAYYLKTIARLKPGVSLSQARSEMETITARFKESVNVVPLEQDILGETRGTLLVLLGAAVCVLLIACANVASLLLVRAAGRRRELALRLSLGAGRWRVVRCLLVESTFLTLIGGALGIPAAWVLVRAFIAFDPVHLPRVQEVAFNTPVLLYAIGAAILTGILFGSAPALRASRAGLVNWLKQGPGVPGAGEFGRNRGRSLLAVAQIALSMMLLVGAGLLMRSFLARVRVPLGFRPDGAIGVDLPWSANRRINELLDRLRALPGVTAAGASTTFPQNAPPFTVCCFDIEAREPADRRQQGDTGLVIATSGYFEAAGMALRRGRFFTPADGPDAPKVAVINESMARRDFGGEDPIGRHVRWQGNWVAVVGVARNVKGFSVASDPQPVIYFPYRQDAWRNPVTVLVRTELPPAGLRAAARKEIRAWNAHVLVSKLDTVEHMMSNSVATPRFYLLLVAGFAILALLVSAVGVYGTINYSVARRTHEIGIRMALGAARADVLAAIFTQGLQLTAAGLVLGLGGAWISTRALRALLFGVEPTDGVAFVCGSGVLAFTVLVACYLPARRATKVDPLEALRHE